MTSKVALLEWVCGSRAGVVVEILSVCPLSDRIRQIRDEETEERWDLSSSQTVFEHERVYLNNI